jgi:hypothetical protein
VVRERGPQAAGQLHPPLPAVPYMVQLADAKDDLRQALEIPAGAVVLGRHGGMTTFNLPWVTDVVRELVDRRRDVHFVFLNTPATVQHPRVHYLAGTHDLVEKRLFINTCDAMLHARAEGETFGLAVAEFSVCNKPVFTWSGSYDQSHIEVLGAKGIYYDGPADLLARLLRWVPQPDGDWDAFSARFSPAPVMQQFSRVFLGQQCRGRQPSPTPMAAAAVADGN